MSFASSTCFNSTNTTSNEVVEEQFHLILTSQGFNSGANLCQSLVADDALPASIHGRDEFDLAKKLYGQQLEKLKNATGSASNSFSSYFGLKQVNNADPAQNDPLPFFFVDGSDFDFGIVGLTFPWASDEPNSIASRPTNNCVVIDYQSRKWDDASCGNDRLMLCRSRCVPPVVGDNNNNNSTNDGEGLSIRLIDNQALLSVLIILVIFSIAAIVILIAYKRHQRLKKGDQQSNGHDATVVPIIPVRNMDGSNLITPFAAVAPAQSLYNPKENNKGILGASKKRFLGLFSSSKDIQIEVSNKRENGQVILSGVPPDERFHILDFDRLSVANQSVAGRSQQRNSVLTQLTTAKGSSLPGDNNYQMEATRMGQMSSSQANNIMKRLQALRRKFLRTSTTHETVSSSHVDDPALPSV